MGRRFEEICSCIYDLTFKPDGSQLLVAVDNKILVYDPNDGTLVTSLKAHKDLVFAVSYAYNGEKFASGSQDKTVIVWSDQHEGLLKYTHNEAIQCLSFSPTSLILLSCAVTDFGIWSQNEKNVSKQKIASRCTTCAWNTDGTYYAIGMYDGTVSIRSTSLPSTADEIARIERPSGDPVWCVRFGQARQINPETHMRRRMNLIEDSSYPGELLAVADWGQSISFYSYDGKNVGKQDNMLGYDPCAMEYFNDGQFLMIGGSSKIVTLHTRDGTDLGTIAQMDSWVWNVKAKPNSNYVVVGCVDGTLACYQIMFSTVHGLYKDYYGYRDNMTEVVVQHLTRQTSVRIRCNDLVRKVAVYNQRLAIQLSDRILIYRQCSGDRENDPLEYKLLDRINQAFDCSLLVVCSHHLILCQERRLQCYDQKGLKQREWIMEALIRYIKVVGGPPGREAILLGLRNGMVCKIFVDNPFPVNVIQLKNAIRCLDISLSRRKMATVDENGICMVFDTITKEMIFQEPNSNSVAWNSDNDDLLCYSGFGTLSIKAKDFSAYQQRMQRIRDQLPVLSSYLLFYCL
uniref:Intraflagellar transport protein 122 homolog n=1 Tax=Acrobeloides nanus TaxID=290746 RepID=A0A914CC48_9BILA